MSVTKLMFTALAFLGGVAALTLNPNTNAKPIQLVLDGSQNSMQMMSSIDRVLQDVKKVADEADGYAAD